MEAGDKGGRASGGAGARGPDRGPSWGPFFFISIVATLLLIGATLFTLRDILTKGRLEQWSYVYEDAKLLPGREVQAPQPENTVRIFFQGTGSGLTPYVHRLRRELNTGERERFVLEQLFAAPPNPRLRSAIPEGTSLRAYYVIDRAAYLDVSREFLAPRSPTPLGERLAVYALVNAIVLNSLDVDAVQILVEGRSVESPWGWMDCSAPLGANLSVIR